MDPSYKFAGLGSFVSYWFRTKKTPPPEGVGVASSVDVPARSFAVHPLVAKAKSPPDVRSASRLPLVTS